MTTSTNILPVPKTSEKAEPVGGLRFDALMSGLLFIFLSGLFMDGWAHFHGEVDDSFFTPWHAVFYGGYVLSVGALVIAMVRNRARGYRGRSAIPAGYDLALIGSVIFAGGGVWDAFWHGLFGLEDGVEALISSSHLVLSVGMFFMLASPFRAAWQRKGSPESFVAFLPATLSLGFSLTGIFFITSYVNTALNPLAALDYFPGFGGSSRTFFNPSLGIASIIITTALTMGFLLSALYRWTLKPGVVTLFFSTGILFMSFLQDEFRQIPAWVLAGIIGDGLYLLLRPSVSNPSGLRWFSFLLPAIAYSLFFLVLYLDVGLWWKIHSWSGGIVIAGITGLFLSYLIAPPRAPAEA